MRRDVQCAVLLVVCAAIGVRAANAHGGFEDVSATIGLDREPEAGAGNERRFGNITEENGGLAFADIDGDGRLELQVSYGDAGSGRLFGWDGSRFAPLAGNRNLVPARMDRAGYFIDIDWDSSPDFVSIQAGGRGGDIRPPAHNSPDRLIGARTGRDAVRLALSRF